MRTKRPHNEKIATAYLTSGVPSSVGSGECLASLESGSPLAAAAGAGVCSGDLNCGLQKKDQRVRIVYTQTVHYTSAGEIFRLTETCGESIRQKLCARSREVAKSVDEIETDAQRAKPGVVVKRNKMAISRYRADEEQLATKLLSHCGMIFGAGFHCWARKGLATRVAPAAVTATELHEGFGSRVYQRELAGATKAENPLALVSNRNHSGVAPLKRDVCAFAFCGGFDGRGALGSIDGERRNELNLSVNSCV